MTLVNEDEFFVALVKGAYGFAHVPGLSFHVSVASSQVRPVEPNGSFVKVEAFFVAFAHVAILSI